MDRGKNTSRRSQELEDNDRMSTNEHLPNLKNFSVAHVELQVENIWVNPVSFHQINQRDQCLRLFLTFIDRF